MSWEKRRRRHYAADAPVALQITGEPGDVAIVDPVTTGPMTIKAPFTWNVHGDLPPIDVDSDESDVEPSGRVAAA